MKIPRRNNNIDENKDRLSDLCDYLLIHILSFLESEKAVQTCILSTRWRNLWKQLPVLSLYYYRFKTLQGFTEFASQFLTLRDDSTSVFTLEFHNVCSDGVMEPPELERILQYAVSHNIKLLNILMILCGNPLRSVKHLEIDADMGCSYAEAPSILLRWLLEISDIESSIVCSNTLQILSLVPNLSKVKLSSLDNLKSLKVKRKWLLYRLSKILIDANLAQLPSRSEKEASQLEEAFKVGSSSIPDGMIDFLLQNSPSKKFHIIN